MCTNKVSIKVKTWRRLFWICSIVHINATKWFFLQARGSQRKKKKGTPGQPSKHLQNMLCLSKYALPFSVIFREEDMFGLFGGCFESLRLSQFHVTDGAQERRCGCKEKHDLTAAPPHTPQLAALFLGVREKIVENFYLAFEESCDCGKTVIGSG